MNRFEAAVTVDKVLSSMSPSSIELSKGKDAIKQITDEIVKAYDAVGVNHTAENIPTGLLYGRIQSGKTRNMVLAAAMALDGRFKVVIVLTSNNNDLVQQTYDDFKNGLPGVKVISKSELINDVDAEVDLLKTVLPTANGAVVIVCSKGQSILAKVIEFLKRVEASGFPTLIFDDEGDQATLDTSTRQRSRGQTDVPSSKIFTLIHSSEFESLRIAVPNSIFVSVTGTPQALFLQNTDSESRPAFIKLIEPGRGYVGGDLLFSNLNPDSNKYITIVDEDEGGILLDATKEIPDGLISAIDFFVVSATMAGLLEGWNKYNMLVHPSLNRFDHALVKKKITDYVNYLIRIIGNDQDSDYLRTINKLKKIYDEIVNTRLAKLNPDFADVINTINLTLPQRQVFVINSDRRGPSQSPSLSYNFLIGGNSIGRGIAVKNLLVTYYTRSPRTARMDTMHQHARMFGYRQDTLRYTKVFLPLTLYTRFYGIHKSDSEMRNFITANSHTLSTIIVPTNKDYGLSPTRSNVIDYSNVDMILPGSQIYPDRPIFEPPQATTIRKKIEKILLDIFPDYQDDMIGKRGVVISTDDALRLVELIKTQSTTSWQDKHIKNYLSFLKEKYGPNVLLRYREAPNRANKRGGTLPSGVISGLEQKAAKDLDMPTLWIFTVRGSKPHLKWAGVDFIYPTLVVPEKNESLYANIS